jgi:hypothetical protein
VAEQGPATLRFSLAIMLADQLSSMVLVFGISQFVRLIDFVFIDLIFFEL